MAKTVAFLYGLGEGKWHSRKFRQSLQAAGYKMTDDPLRADILITHSGGSLLLSPQCSARTILSINHTYWPGRGLLASHWRRQQNGFRAHKLRWIGLNAINFCYLFRLRHTWRLAKAWPRRAKPVPVPESAQVVFARARQDEFCEPHALLETQGAQCYISFLGMHDDCWFNPEPYINLLQSEQHEQHTQP